MRYWLVFDVETVPDADAGRRWLHLDGGLADRQVREMMMAARRDQTGQSDFLKPPFHQVVAISAALIDADGTMRRLGPLGQPHDDEASLLRSFFQVIDEVKPRLVGWNSSGFDIPTILYRAMRHHIVAGSFYRFGEPYHGYRKRFDEESHLDLMDLLCGYGASPRVTLDEMAAILAIPGKVGIDGSDVLTLFDEGNIARIRSYCSHDVLTTALIFMHYAFHREWLDESKRLAFFRSARQCVLEGDEKIWGPYREAWQHRDPTFGTE